VSLKTTAAEACLGSATFIYTGQTAYCNGSSSAESTRTITVVAAPPPKSGNVVDEIAPAGPSVKLFCPKGAKPKGCTFKLQAVSAKPTKHRKAMPESALAKAKVKAGKSETVLLHPMPAFASRLASAKKILVRETVIAKGKSATRYVRLRAVG
jgi:hypothetical protein